jgi:succinoglycan biosynthesis transport protein ExoP
VRQSAEASGLSHYLRVLRRGLWIVILTTAVMTALAVYLSARQPKLYQASADVFLNTQNLAASLSDIQPPYVDPVRAAETQARLARGPAVAARAIQEGRISGRTADALLGQSSVVTTPNADLLTFSVTDGNPDMAARLATAYAKAYTDYRHELDTKSLVEARQEIERRMTELKTEGDQRSQLYANLADKDQRLRTTELLQTSNASVVRDANDAAQIQPQPRRNGILAAILGLMLGVALAFLRDALNTRVRTAAEIQERLDLPLLGRVPAPPKKLRGKNNLTMLARPNAPEAEAFRILATNLEFMNIDRGASSVLITSASRGEGKSTTISNLAVAFARAGRRVALVDLDLRRPSIQRYFNIDTDPGVTNVALGRATLDQALVRIPVLSEGREALHASSNGGSAIGSLEVLPAGSLPPNAGEFAGSRALANVLQQLSERADLVLVDAPPILQVSDAMMLSAKIDGLLVVTRLPEIRRPVVEELRRVLETAPIVKLGFVVTGASAEEGYGYGYGYSYGYAHEGRRDRARVR